jgi:hypothetical protein
MITITFQPNNLAELDAALALLQSLRVNEAASDDHFQRMFREATVEPETETIVLTDEREPGADEAPAPVKRARRSKPEAPAAEQAPEIPAPFPEAPAEPVYTLEQVRARLAEISHAGKKAELVEILRKYGASRLTEIAAADYAALMVDVEAL